MMVVVGLLLVTRTWNDLTLVLYYIMYSHILLTCALSLIMEQSRLTGIGSTGFNFCWEVSETLEHNCQTCFRNCLSVRFGLFEALNAELPDVNGHACVYIGPSIPTFVQDLAFVIEITQLTVIAVLLVLSLSGGAGVAEAQSNRDYVIQKMSNEIHEIIRVLQLTTYDEEEWDADDITVMKKAQVQLDIGWFTACWNAVMRYHICFHLKVVLCITIPVALTL